MSGRYEDVKALGYPPSIIRRARDSGRHPDDIAAIRRFYASFFSSRRTVAPGAWWAIGAAYPAELKP